MAKAANASTGNEAFSREIASLKREELVRLLDEKFGMTVTDERLTKEDLAREAINLYNQQKKNADEENEKSAKMVETPKDPIVKVLFINLDAPKAPHEFSYDSGRGIKGKNNPNGLPKIPTYRLIDHEVSAIPYSVYKHLNGLTVPDNRFDVTEGGFIKGVMSGKRKRFSCELILTDEQVAKLSV